MTRCNGIHELKPRFDFERIGEVVKRTYVCEVCEVCGHVVPRVLSIKDQIELGLVTSDEVREFLRQGGTV